MSKPHYIFCVKSREGYALPNMSMISRPLLRAIIYGKALKIPLVFDGSLTL